jgi:hypothetical protein
VEAAPWLSGSAGLAPAAYASNALSLRQQVLKMAAVGLPRQLRVPPGPPTEDPMFRQALWGADDERLFGAWMRKQYNDPSHP